MVPRQIFRSLLFVGLTITATSGLHVGTSQTTGVSVRIGAIPDTATTTLWSVPPKRMARRDLKKRRRKSKGGASPNDGQWNGEDYGNDDYVWQTTEIRPLIKAEAKEKGVDYWMDEEELKKYNDALRRRPREAGQVPDEKLWKEVLSPYKENWIGLFSVGIIVIAALISQFPELLQSPVISIPDL